MSLCVSAEQRQIQDEAKRFLAAAFSAEKLRALLNTRGAFDAQFWRSCAEMGWTGAGIPEAFGGVGLGAPEVGLIAEECGRVVAGAPFLAPSYAAAQAVLRWGAPSTQEAFLPKLARGEATCALALLDADGELASPAVRLEGARLSGTCPAVAAGAAASHALVSVADPTTTLVLVDLSAACVVRTPGDTFDNSRCTARLDFDGAPSLPLAPPDARAAVMDVLATWATLLAFEQVGGGEAAMQRARAYACERQAFGQPIGKFQAIKHRIAEMFVAIELARGNALAAAAAITSNAPDRVLKAAAARLAATQAFEFAAAEAIQTHGAIGVTWEHDLHLYLRRARALALEAGARFFWEDVIVDALDQERRP